MFRHLSQDRSPLLGGAICVALLMTLAGCSVRQVERQDHGLTIPEKFASSKEDTGSPAIDLDHWVLDFNDPVLVDLIEEALKSNRDLGRAAARVDEARALAQVRLGSLLPSLQISSDGSRARSNFEVSPGVKAKSLSSSVGLGAGLNWEVDVWGRLSKERKAALSDFRAASEDYRAAQLSLSGQTARSWFGVVEAQQQLKLTHGTVKSFDRAARLVRGRYERGLARGLDVRLAESNLASAKSLESQRANQLARAQTELEVLLGRYPAAQLASDQQLPELEPVAVNAIPSDLLARRPDLSASQARLVAAELRGDAAWRELLPAVRISGGAGYRDQDVSDLINPQNLIWSLVGEMVQPIFNGGALRAQAKAAEARGHQALAVYADNLLRAFKDVEDSLSGETHLAAQEVHLARAAHEAIEAEKLANDLYARGLSNILELLEAQRRSLNAQSSLLDVKQLRLSNRVTLYLALGGNIPNQKNERSRLKR